MQTKTSYKEVENIKDEREQIWLKKRAGKITSSILPNLMKGGRSKSEIWGKVAIDAMYAVKYERRTGLTRESKLLSQFDWGHQNEPLAIEWLKEKIGMNEIKSCNTDFDEIVFNEPFAGFGDSPDAYLYDFNGNIEAVIEIKCPVDQSKIEALNDYNKITEQDEYFYQFLGHFIGCPDAKYLIYLIFDGYNFTGRTLTMDRIDWLPQINAVTKHIKKANSFIDLCLSEPEKYILNEINNY